MAESQLVTVAGINKVWSATMALYNKLDHRLDNIGRLYTPKGTLADFNNGLLTTSAVVGDTWIVGTGYPAFSEDPENFPAYSSYPSGSVPERPFICIKDFNGTVPSGETWEDYWNPINLNLNIASDDNYGVVKLGYISDTHGTKVDINDGNLYVPLYDIEEGNNITIDSPTSNSKKIHADIYKSVDGQGIKIIDGVTSNNITERIVRNIGLIDGTTAAAGASGTVYFYKGKDDGTTIQVGVPVYGWGDKQNADKAVKHSGTVGTDTPKVGNTSKPIYVSSNGEADVITSLSLGDSSTTINVATFTSATSGNSANTVEITGYGSAATDPGADGRVALKVTGSARISEALSATKVYHAVWNDISDAIEVQDTLKTDPGYCYFFDGKEYHRTGKYCQKGIIGIHSDTAGSVLGRKGKHKELDISVGGFVLAYVDKEYAPGTPLTSAPNGRLTKMSLISRILHPERLVATYWKKETNKEWGDESHKVEVNGRHWVKVR